MGLQSTRWALLVAASPSSSKDAARGDSMRPALGYYLVQEWTCHMEEIKLYRGLASGKGGGAYPCCCRCPGCPHQKFLKRAAPQPGMGSGEQVLASLVLV